MVFAADRSEHVRSVVLPALEAGRAVVCERFADAMIVYQGYGRGVPLGIVQSLARPPFVEVLPDRTVVLDVDPVRARDRVRQRDVVRVHWRLSRLEAEPLEFQERERAGYRALAAEHPGRIRGVDGEGVPEAVAERVWAAVADLLVAKRSVAAG